ncbi:hypothetical protein PQR65_38455 [Paraburkholderia nemoris]|uniref:hypothetical protein n=1 Tax=Paraburkholderia nemoris TaxID=2793076 RepID=UPI0038B82BB4
MIAPAGQQPAMASANDRFAEYSAASASVLKVPVRVGSCRSHIAECRSIKVNVGLQKFALIHDLLQAAIM